MSNRIFNSNQVGIQNLMGQQRYTATVKAPLTGTGISRLSTRAYFLTLQAGNGRIARRFVKQ